MRSPPCFGPCPPVPDVQRGGIFSRELKSVAKNMDFRINIEALIALSELVQEIS